jgi:hypothetical protein
VSSDDPTRCGATELGRRHQVPGPSCRAATCGWSGNGERLTHGHAAATLTPMCIQPDPAVLDEQRAGLGLPPAGVKLDREQSLRLLDALDAPYPPPAPHVEAWARQVLGLHAATA